MTISKQEKFLNLLPDLYEINLNSKNQSDTIFEKFKQFIDFDEGFIYFLNADSLQLKYSYKNHANYKVEDKFYFQEDFKNFLFTKEAVVLDKKSEFIKIVNLDELNKKSYIRFVEKFRKKRCFWYLKRRSLITIRTFYARLSGRL